MKRGEIIALLLLGFVVLMLKRRRERPALVPLPGPAPEPKRPAKLRPFADFLAEVRRLESSNNYRARRRTKSGKLSQFWGAYQLGKLARKDAGVLSDWETFSNSQTLQDQAATRWFELLAKRVGRHGDIVDAIAAGSVRGEPFDLSRAVAMAHHTGTAALRRWIAGQPSAQDSFGTKSVPFTRTLHGFQIGGKNERHQTS